MREFQLTYRWCLQMRSIYRKTNIQFRSTQHLRSQSTSNGEKRRVVVERLDVKIISTFSSGDCMTRIHKLLRDEDFERAVLLMRAGRVCWPESECFGVQDAQPEDELMVMKDIFLADLETGKLSFVHSLLSVVDVLVAFTHLLLCERILINFPFWWRSKRRQKLFIFSWFCKLVAIRIETLPLIKPSNLFLMFFNFPFLPILIKAEFGGEKL